MNTRIDSFLRAANLQKWITIRKRWITIILLFVVVPIVVILVAFVHSLNSKAIENAINYSDRTVSSSQKALRNQMEYAEVISNSIIRRIYDEMTEDSEKKNRYEEYYMISSLFSSALDDSLIDGFRLYVSKDKPYSHQMESFFPLEMMDQEILKYFQSGRKDMWLTNFDRTRFYSGESTRVFSFVTALRSPSNYDDYMAFLFADIPVERIMDMINVDQESDMMITDSQGIVLAARDAGLAGTSLGIQDLLKSDAGHVFSKIQGTEKLVSWAKVEDGPFYLVNVTDKYRLQKNYAIPSVTVVIGVMVCIVLGFVLVFIFATDSMLTRINRAVMNLQNHSLKWMTPKKENDELPDTIEQAVDEIARKVNSLVEENYRIRMENQEIELKALQAQINPHFLYNTLESIRWMILDGDEETSVKMLNCLSRYYRLSLNKGRDIVPLRDEYELIRNYLTIQKMRFDNRFDVQWSVKEEVLCCSVPKLCLQPIVENAVLHGDENRPEDTVMIQIEMFQEGENAVVRISDTGSGMSRETIEQVFAPDGTSKGYGLRNVNRRLILMHGTMQIESEPGRGTTVTLKIPFIKYSEQPKS